MSLVKLRFHKFLHAFLRNVLISKLLRRYYDRVPIGPNNVAVTLISTHSEEKHVGTYEIANLGVTCVWNVQI